MATEPLREADVCAATSFVLARDGFKAFSLASVASKLGTSREDLERSYPSEKSLLSALVVRAFRVVGDRVIEAVEASADGSEALTNFVRVYASHFLERIDEFRQVLMLRQIVGSERFGLGPDEMRSTLIPIINKPLDRLEAKLIGEGGRGELPAAIHPRRLAFSAMLTVVGLVTLRGSAQGAGITLSHTNDALIIETSRALGGGLATMRQLAALNEASAALARSRTEAQLLADVPKLLTKVLTLESTALAIGGKELADTEMPEEARRALEQGLTVQTPAENESGVVLATPVRYEGAPAGVLWGVHRSAGRTLDERDVARIETFATMVGLALENVRLYEDLQVQLDARRKKLTEAHAQLMQAEKMASLGNLVAGVAHELNTPIGAIASNADVARRAIEIVLPHSSRGTAHRLLRRGQAHGRRPERHLRDPRYAGRRREHVGRLVLLCAGTSRGRRSPARRRRTGPLTWLHGLALSPPQGRSRVRLHALRGRADGDERLPWV